MGMKYEEIYQTACTRLRDIITAINKADNEELAALCLSSMYDDTRDLYTESTEEWPTYHVDILGNCSFNIGKYKFCLGKINNIHEDKEFGEEGTTDIAVLYCYSDYMFHLVPNGFIYGATNISEFADGKQVNKILVEAAKKYVKDTWKEDL